MNKKIILIDDDELMVKELSNLLIEEGFDLDAFTDPEIGLDRLLENNYDLLLLDIKMPKISGTDILKIARSKGLKTKIITITGNPILLDKESLNGATDKKEVFLADFVLNKPFDPNLLLSKINELITC